MGVACLGVVHVSGTRTGDVMCFDEISTWVVYAIAVFD